MKHRQELKDKAIQLRMKKCSLKEISRELRISKSTASNWVRDYPLPEEEVLRRRVANGFKVKGMLHRETVIYNNKPNSKFYDVIKDKEFSTNQKCAISESAIQFRLAVYGFEIFKSVHDGSVVDIVARNENNGLLSLQIKTIKNSIGHGLPVVNLRHKSKKGVLKRYNENDFDFLVGYDILKDIAYVFSKKELELNMTGITVKRDAEENWDKLRL